MKVCLAGCNTLARPGGVSCYNDTAATNPYAASKSILTIGVDGLAVIVGGEDKNLDFDVLAATLLKVPYVFVCRAALLKKLENENDKYGKNKKTYLKINNIEEGFRETVRLSAKNLLFSPGAASFNMFNNEFHRGERFIEAVNTVSYEFKSERNKK